MKTVTELTFFFICLCCHSYGYNIFRKPSIVKRSGFNPTYLTRTMFYVGDVDPHDNQLTQEEVYDFFHFVIGFSEKKSLRAARQLFRLGDDDHSKKLTADEAFKAMVKVARQMIFR